MEFPFLTERAIDHAAEKLVVDAFGAPWLARTPVDLEAIVYDHLSPRENLSYDDEADLAPENGETVLGKTLPRRGKILLNKALKLEQEPGRARFTLAHELGHWVLHKPQFCSPPGVLDLFDGVGLEEPEYEFVGLNRAIFPSSCRPGAVAREEWQANRFAVALLVNPRTLNEEFEVRFGAPPVVRSSAAWRSRGATVRELAKTLARYDERHPPIRDVFGLSVEAMAIALESRGYVMEAAPLV